MRTAAGVVSAVLLFAPGCADEPQDKAAPADPVRGANFRSLAAHDFLITCPGGATRRETAAAVRRHAELIQLGMRKDAGHVLALGENDWNALRRHDERAPCAPGEAPYRRALAAYDQALDALAGRIADHGGAR